MGGEALRAKRQETISQGGKRQATKEQKMENSVLPLLALSHGLRIFFRSISLKVLITYLRTKLGIQSFKWFNPNRFSLNSNTFSAKPCRKPDHRAKQD